MRYNNTITDVPGIQVGHAQDEEAMTGCTVILCEAGAVGGVDQRGGAPGTRETDLLKPMHQVQKVHAVLLAGGSAFGLDAAGGVMRYLEEHGVGYDTQVARVPIVSAAILFDLAVGRVDIRPDAEMGYRASLNASREPPSQGNAGAGCGATVGKILGMSQAMKAGIGSASIHLGGGVVVGAIVAVNAFGDIIDPTSGALIAGARNPRVVPDQSARGEVFIDTLNLMKSHVRKTRARDTHGENTVIGVVASNAALTKEQANKVAQMSHDGLARTIRPAHTMVDGDTIFALSTGSRRADVNIIGAYAAEVFAQAVLNAARNAKSIAGLPGLADWPVGTNY